MEICHKQVLLNNEYDFNRDENFPLLILFLLSAIPVFSFCIFTVTSIGGS